MDIERHGIGGNSRFTLPESEAEAARWVLDRYSKLTNDRRVHSEMITEVKKEAEADHNIDRQSLTTSIRLAKMTPERREKWFDATFAGAAMFGVRLEWSDDAEDEKRKHYVERVLRIEADRREIAAEIRELLETAADAGIDPEAIKLLHNLRHKNEESEDSAGAEDFFHRLDSLGAKLGFW